MALSIAGIGSYLRKNFFFISLVYMITAFIVFYPKILALFKGQNAGYARVF